MLENEIVKIQSDGAKPSLLLHACCAPCSSYVLEYLTQHFDITLFYYNPNISPENEYRFRVDEVKRLISQMPCTNNVKFVESVYNPEKFYDIAKGAENEDEGGSRCFKCYRLRLEKTAEYAALHGFDYFTTTLSISPYKNAEKLNTIGAELGEQYNVKYLFSDFKKKNGYKRSIELSKEYDLYRQDYCGCEFSRFAAERRKNNEA
ncbi:MAG: epoxyqueuosine reductase QueH [Clostridia bacterium]|nr:epoxyqueuosine reductase QueH [Clostridia bacterium]